MLNLNLSRLTSELAGLVMMSGGEDSLEWHGIANRGAKKALDAIDDNKLFGDVGVRSDEMASAIRALLYLWNGWTADCKMYAQATAEPERSYIAGICARVSGQPEEAKKHFQTIQEHPLYAELGKQVLAAIDEDAGPELSRFRQVVALAGAWEPFAYVDLFEQARAGKVRNARQQLVIKLQVKEFEHLFCHCYRGATGVNPMKRDNAEAEAAPRSRFKKKPAPSRKPAKAPTAPAKEKRITPSERPQREATSMQIRCPKCGATLKLSAEARGKKVKCFKCTAVFLAGGGNEPEGSRKPGRAASAPTPPPSVKIVCPRCQQMASLAESARGQKHRCKACGTAFLVPGKAANPAPSSAGK